MPYTDYKKHAYVDYSNAITVITDGYINSSKITIEKNLIDITISCSNNQNGTITRHTYTCNDDDHPVDIPSVTINQAFESHFNNHKKCSNNK